MEKPYHQLSVPSLRLLAATAGPVFTVVGTEELVGDGFPSSPPWTKRKEKRKRETKVLMPTTKVPKLDLNQRTQYFGFTEPSSLVLVETVTTASRHLAARTRG